MAFYLYALAPSGLELSGLRGLREEPLTCLRLHSFIAIAGEVSEVPPASIALLGAQDRLVRALGSRSDALLPSRFGTHERSAAALIARLELHDDKLATALERVRGCEQMNLRVFADAAPALETEASQATGEGTRYLHRARERLSPSLPELDGLRQRFGALVRGERAKGAQQPPLRASVFHLIPRGSEPEYQALLAKAPRPRGVRWLASGPFPPYAFAPEELS